MSKRKEWIDGLRGLAMLFVIYVHILQGVRPISLFSSPVKLPLFFAVTGYVFSFKNGNANAFFRSLWKGLILPYLTFSAVYTLVKIIGGTAISEAALEFLSGNVAWYIPCLIAAEILFFCVRKCFKGIRLQAIVLAGVSAAGYFLSKTDSLLWDFIARAMIVQSYILIGHIFRNLEEKIDRPKLWPAVFPLIYLAVGVYVLIAYEGSVMDVQSNSYYNPVLCALMVVSGCSGLLYYGRYLKMPRWLVFIGQNTLIFYLFHGRILDMLRPMIGLIPHSLRVGVVTGLPISLGILAALCGVCALCSVLINRYIPFLAGKPQKAFFKKV